MPRSTTPRSRCVITNAVSARSASVDVGRFSSSTLPWRSATRTISNGVTRTPWFGKTAKALTTSCSVASDEPSADERYGWTFDVNPSLAA